MLVAVPAIYPGLRKSVKQNLSDIIQLHKEILGELHRAVSISDYKEFGTSRSPIKTADQMMRSRMPTHHRSADVRASDVRSRTLAEAPEICSEPQVIVEVSKLFERKAGVRTHAPSRVSY
jgi:hypothetical protein